MSTTEKVQPANPEHGGQNAHPAPAEAHFEDPTPTTPLELPTQPSRSLGELIRSRAKAIAAGLTTAAVAVGLVALGTSGKEAVAGTPVATGQGGDAPAAGPLVPGGEKADNPEVAQGNLCDIIPIDDLAEWTTGSRYAFPPKDQIDCSEYTPTDLDIHGEVVAAGTWDFHDSGSSSYPVDYISMQVIKDEIPGGGGSVFDQRPAYFEEEPHTREVNGQEVTAVSGNGTTLMKVGDYDVSFTIKMPEGLGGDNSDPSVYSPLHRAELQAAEQLFPTLGLAPEA